MSSANPRERLAGLDATTSFWWILLALAASGLVLRIAAILLVPTTFGDLSSDGLGYYLSALALADGDGFVNPQLQGNPETALHPPLWATVLSIPARLGLRDIRELQVFGALLGAATIVLVGLAARRIASPRAGLVAAAVAALYPGLWLYERTLYSETVAYPLLALFLLLAYRYHRAPTWPDLVGLAITVGLLALTRSELLALAPFVVAPLVLSRPGPTMARRIGSLALCAAIVVVLLAPWALHNAGRFEEAVLLSSGAGGAMRAGACDETFAGAKLGSYEAACVFRDSLQNPGSDDSQLEPILRRSAIDYTFENLDRFPVVLLAREGRSWSLWAPAHQVELNEVVLNAPAAVLWSQHLAFWIVLPFAVGGVVVLRRRGTPVYPLVALVVIVALSTALTFGDVRYRAAAELPLIILAAAAVDALADRRAGGTRHRTPADPRAERPPSTEPERPRRRSAASTGAGFALRIQQQDEKEAADRSASEAEAADAAGADDDTPDPTG